MLLHSMQSRQSGDATSASAMPGGSGTAPARSRAGKAILLSLVLFANIIYLIWRICATLPHGEGWLSFLFALGLLAAELLGLFELCVTLDGIHHQYVPPLPAVSPDAFPAVDVFIATYNEDAALLRKTVEGCKAMEYPDPQKVQIYLCDDGNRPAIQALAASLGVHYLARSGNHGAKAGNLNHAMCHSTAPLIATFDADMIPTPQFLLQTVPYFCTGERLGFLQTPQSFHNPDLFQQNFRAQRRIPNEQDYFYRKVQPTKNHGNTVIYGGSNTLISRAALSDVGGFYEDSITEDFATGILIQSKGYQCYAIPTVLAAGLSPTDLKSLFAQRERWARGCIQTVQQLNIRKQKGLTLRQKISYYSAISYWYSCVKRLFYIAAPIAFAVFGVKVVDCTLREVLCIFLPTYLLTNLVLVRSSGQLRATRWTNIYETIFFPHLLGAVLLESMGRRKGGFSVTDKSGVPLQDTAYARRKARVFWVYIVLSLIGIANVVIYSGGYQSFNFVVVLGWLVVNLLYLIMALLFVRGTAGVSPCGQNKTPLAKEMAGGGCLLFDLLHALR